MAVTGVNDYTSTYAASNSGSTRGSSGLSETAQNYLNELKQKYPDTNITVADFSSEQSKLSYMFGCSGGNVAISANIVEKMATDSAAAAKYEKVIGGVSDLYERVEKHLDDRGQVLYGCGVVIDKNGKTSYWMIGGDKAPRKNPGTAYKESVTKILEEKRAKKKEEEKLKEKRLKQAETMEELLEKIKANAQDGTVISEEGKGRQFDLSI